MNIMNGSILEFVKIISPFVFSYLLFKLSSKNSRLEKEDEYCKNILKERIEKLYNPIYIEYMTEIYPRLNYVVPRYDCGSVDFFIDNVYKIDKIFLENIQYASTESQKLFIEFHSLVLSRFTHELENVSSPSLDEDIVLSSQYESLFNAHQNLCKTLFIEYADMCNKLKLPKPII